MQPCAHKSVWGDCLSTVHANVRLFQKCIIIIVVSISTTNSDLIVVDARVIAHAADSTQLFQSREFTGFDLLAVLVPEHTTKTCTYIYTCKYSQSHTHTYGRACKIYLLAWEIHKLLFDSTHPKLSTQAGSRSGSTEAAKCPFSIGLVSFQTDLDYCFVSVDQVGACLFFEQVHITWEAHKRSRWTFPYRVSLVIVFSSCSKHHNFHLIVCIDHKCQCSHFSKLHQCQDNFQGVIKRHVLAP